MCVMPFFVMTTSRIKFSSSRENENANFFRARNKLLCKFHTTHYSGSKERAACHYEVIGLLCDSLELNSTINCSFNDYGGS